MLTLFLLFLTTSIAYDSACHHCDHDILVSVLETFPVLYPTSTSYVCTENEAIAIMHENLDFFFSHHQISSPNQTEILIFPEEALFGDEFEPEHRIHWDLLQNFQIELPHYSSLGLSLCPTSSSNPNQELYHHPILVHIACEAKHRGTWTTLNLADFDPVKQQRYNTIIIIDNQGRFQGKYHKRHLFPDDLNLFSPGEDRVEIVEINGKKFGFLICFDIFFVQPIKELVSKGVEDVIYTTYWVNYAHVPYISAVTIQQAFSRVYGVRVYASNMNVGYYHSGSGIYDSGRPIAYTFNTNKGEKVTRVLRSDGQVEGIRNPRSSMKQKERKRRPITRDDNAKLHVEPFIARPKNSHSFRYDLTDNGETLVGCELNITIENTRGNETFAFIVYSGLLVDLVPVQLCGLIRCTNPSSCFTNDFEINTSTSFASFDLASTFEQGKESTPAFPLIATDNAQLLEVDTFDSDYETKLILRRKNSVLLNAFLLKSFEN
ncbi:hypothetical protein P9112_002930 [Eukaryota sp. TZLM1-RC]